MEETVGGRISDLLKQNGFTQRELAARAGITEVSMSRYIRGERIPKGEILKNLALALHTTPEYLLNKEPEDDSELVYYQTQRSVARYADRWSKKQKIDLISALFGNG